MDKKYCVIVRTGDAELRAMHNLPEDSLQKILPIVELTRGRAKNIGTKETPNYIYPYESKRKKIVEVFKGKEIAFDVTSELSLTSQEIDKLFDYQNGYENWIKELTYLKGEGVSLIPSIIMNYDDLEFSKNIRAQIEKLSLEFRSLMYRCSLDNEIAKEDIRLIVENMPSSVELFIVLDCGWIPASSYKNPADVCISKIEGIEEVLEKTQISHSIAVCATTFPNNISEIGDDIADTLDLGEISLYERVKDQHPEIIYGDYGSINPVRNDQIVMSHGWIPRIDVALQTKIYYYRERRPGRTSPYADTYTAVAKKAVSDERFPAEIDEWGFLQIRSCALGDAPSASPSFWISVRLNSHIIQQIRRLGI